MRTLQQSARGLIFERHAFRAAEVLLTTLLGRHPKEMDLDCDRHQGSYRSDLTR